MLARRVLCNLLVVLLLAGCSAGAPVRVLDKGTSTISASLGGPIVPGKSPVGFIPYLTAGAAHGVTDAVTVHANAHALMGAFAVLGLDAGASYRLVRGADAVPEITLGARFLFFTDFRALNTTRLYPDIHAILSWELSEDLLAYGGTHVTFQFSPSKTFVSPMIGMQIPISSGFRLQTELIWQAANVNTQGGVFEGVSTIGTTGSFGGFVGGTWLL